MSGIDQRPLAVVTGAGGGTDRLRGFAALPLQDPSAAATELARAVGDLGMLGAYVGVESVAGQLDAPVMDELYDAFVDLDVPLLLHPAPDGIDGPVGDPRLGRWDLQLLLGFASDETLALATLIYGGVLHRHPPWMCASRTAAARCPTCSAGWQRLPRDDRGRRTGLPTPGRLSGC